MVFRRSRRSNLRVSDEEEIVSSLNSAKNAVSSQTEHALCALFAHSSQRHVLSFLGALENGTLFAVF